MTRIATHASRPLAGERGRDRERPARPALPAPGRAEPGDYVYLRATEIRAWREANELSGRLLFSFALTLDDVVDLEDLRLARELYPNFVQDRHKALTEGLKLLLRVPDFADTEVAARTEGDVILKPVRREVALRLKAAAGLVVLLRRDARRTCESDKDAHVPPLLGAQTPIACAGLCQPNR